MDLPPLAWHIECCLMDFAMKMNLTWIFHGGDTFEPDFEAQAAALFHLANRIEDAMDEIPDNNGIYGEIQDELVLYVEGLSF